ncbi:MAG: hypothetical protein WCG02_01415 [Candidatus Taylorbacteria bacterium]
MLTQVFFNKTMIELTTGAIFLMSSLYGNGQMENSTVNIPAPVTIEATTTIDSSTATSTKAMEAYLRQEFAETPLLVDIARCESSFRQYDKNGNIVRGRVNSADIGVMQINEMYHDKTAVKLGIDLHTLEGNVAYAKHLYAEQGSQPWVSSSKCWSADQVAMRAK